MISTASGARDLPCQSPDASLEPDVERARETVASGKGTSSLWEREQQALNQITIRPDALDGDLSRFRAWRVDQGVARP